jgi:transcriptional regulator of acetoin/glycerol metabolism
MPTPLMHQVLPTGRRHRDDGSHDRPIASALAFDGDHVSSINESHERCAALGLSRIGPPDYSPLGRADLSVVRDRNQRLFGHAAPVMEMLFEQIARTQSMVVLTDAQGTILHSIGDDDFLEKAAKVAMQPGVNWAECAKGTNGIGTALVDERPMLVHADEHFMHAHHILTCSAAPIMDPRGNILGVLDVTGDRRAYHQHTMGLVKMSARMIENHWLTDDFRHALRLHFHSRVEFIGTLMEGILAVDRDGRIIGANRSALDLLGMSGAAVRMHSVTTLLGSPVGLIVDAFRSPLAVPLRLNLPNGEAVYVQARCNWPIWNAGWPADTAAAGEAGPSPQGKSALRPVSDTTMTTPQGLRYLQTGDAQIDAVVGKLKRVLNRDLPVLILGEPGTGKEMLARAIHQDSHRTRHPFVVVDCSSPEAEVEVDLFGNAEPATGGGSARRKGAPGKLVQASGGTLYFDAIGGLSLTMQTRLVRLLQERKFVPAPGAKPVDLDVSIIASSTQQVRELIDAGQLREDLYYRLNGLAVKLPALRERSDLLALVRQILRERSPQSPPELSPEVMELLEVYHWPGNLRELAHVLRTATVVATGEPRITRDHLSDDFLEEATRRLALRRAGQQHAADRAAQAASASQPAVVPPAASPLQAQPSEAGGSKTLEQAELDMIRQAVDAAQGNISVASKRLGISRNTIYRKLRWRQPA